MKYLDPKNDLVFRKLFGEHPHLLLSFLNCILPLEPNQIFEHIQYPEPEITHEHTGLKRSAMEVYCIDSKQITYIIEIQMYWTSAFKQRMLFNTGKALVQQLKGSGKFRELNQVYGLSLIDDVFHTAPKMKDTFYHHYQLIHKQVSNEQIKGLELIFIELPKFQSKNFTDNSLQTLWLRFLTEINESTTAIPHEFLTEPTLAEALKYVQKNAFTNEEQFIYNQNWDAIQIEKEAIEELEEKNIVLQNEKKEALAREDESKQKLINSAREMLSYGLPIELIIKSTGLTRHQIEHLPKIK